MSRNILLLLTLTLSLSSPIFSAKAEQKRAPAALNIATFNVRNYGASEEKSMSLTNKRLLKSMITKTKADIMAIQEIVNVKDFKSFINSNFKNYRTAISKCGGKGKQHLGFVYNSNRLKLTKTTEDDRVKDKKPCAEGLRPVFLGHFSELRTTFKFVAMAIHLKAGGQPRNIETRHKQFTKLSTIIKDYKRKGNKNLVLLGDFNTTEYLSRNRHYDNFINWINKNRLIDFSASIDCTSYWWGGIDDGLLYSSLLDHIIVTNSMWDHFNTQQVEVQSHCKRVSCNQRSEESLGNTYLQVSDHCPVIASLK